MQEGETQKAPRDLESERLLTLRPQVPHSHHPSAGSGDLIKNHKEAD